MGADDAVEILAIASAVGGLILALFAWRRAARLDGRRQSSHPAASTPITLTIDTSTGAPRWRMHVDERWPTVGLDILTYRRAGTTEAWVDEPLMRPVSVPPGASALLDTELPDATGPYDVVAGWTVHRPEGPSTGSATMVVPSNVTAVVPARTTVRPYRFVYPVVVAVLVAATVLAVTGLASDDTSAGDLTEGSPSPSDSTATDRSDPPVGDTTPPTTAPTTTVPPATTAAPTSPSTTAPASTAPTTVPDGPRVEITSRVEDCRFGQACVIASFRVVDFVGSGRYVCEFDDGSRFEFRYGGDGADDACARSGPAPTITIEVDGIRSRTVGR